MDYNFSEIEPKWQRYWREQKTYHVENNPDKPHYYVLDMFPYPSGAGLHVGHPLGYIASDIYARYKRLRGFNVLHPMGYDAYGLPAEQYAIQTGQHPAITTEQNINRYREQLDKIGFSFDWDREVRTCDPAYYKWTQWTFLQLFNHYYDEELQKARPISELIAKFEKGDDRAPEWNTMSEKERQDLLMDYRLAYLADIPVNWCAELGTVLANDEVVNGLSVRGGYPVERKLMRQWSLRISAYAQRLVDGLEQVDWSESLKEIQRNWIGRSEGAAVWFPLDVKTNANVLPGAQVVENMSKAKGVSNLFLNAYHVMTNLSNFTEVTDTGKGTFLMMVNMLPHRNTLLSEPDYVPADYIDNTEYDREHADRFDAATPKLTQTTADQMTHYDANMCTIMLVADWLDTLREMGVYDNTRIIFVADHGMDVRMADSLILPDGEDIMAYNPLLLVKDFGASGEIRTDNTFMTNADVPTLAMADLIRDPVNPFTEKPIDGNVSKQEKQYITMSHDWDTDYNNGNVFFPATWYTVQDNALDVNNWENAGVQ